MPWFGFAYSVTVCCWWVLELIWNCENFRWWTENRCEKVIINSLNTLTSFLSLFIATLWSVCLKYFIYAEYINVWFFLFARYLFLFKNKFNDVWFYFAFINFIFRIEKNSLFPCLRLLLQLCECLFVLFIRPRDFCAILFICFCSLLSPFHKHLFLNISPVLYNFMMIKWQFWEVADIFPNNLLRI